MGPPRRAMQWGTGLFCQSSAHKEPSPKKVKMAVLESKRFALEVMMMVELLVALAFS